MTSQEVQTGFMDHPLWSGVLSFSETSGEMLVKLKNFSQEKRRMFLELCTGAFYPISWCSALSFARLAQLTEDAETRKTARYISEVEQGLHPLVPGSLLEGVRHCDQLRLLLSSLEPDFEIKLPAPDEFEITKEVLIQEANLCTALAVCEVIEATAPAVIHNYADFTARWQTTFAIPTSRICRAYLDEHNLTEGNDCAEQHISLVEDMRKAHANLVTTTAYADAQAAFHAACNRHLEEVFQKISALFS